MLEIYDASSPTAFLIESMTISASLNALSTWVKSTMTV